MVSFRNSDRMEYERIQVECHSGYKVNEYPAAFTFHGHHWEISDILDRWYEGGIDARQQEISYFKVRTSEGQVFLLRYLPLFDAWSVRI